MHRSTLLRGVHVSCCMARWRHHRQRQVRRSGGCIASGARITPGGAWTRPSGKFGGRLWFISSGCCLCVGCCCHGDAGMWQWPCLGGSPLGRHVARVTSPCAWCQVAVPKCQCGSGLPVGWSAEPAMSRPLIFPHPEACAGAPRSSLHCGGGYRARSPGHNGKSWGYPHFPATPAPQPKPCHKAVAEPHSFTCMLCAPVLLVATT